MKKNIINFFRKPPIPGKIIENKNESIERRTPIKQQILKKQMKSSCSIIAVENSVEINFAQNIVITIHTGIPFTSIQEFLYTRMHLPHQWIQNSHILSYSNNYIANCAETGEENER